MQHDALEVALVLGGAAQVEELALRTPSTRGTVGAVCGSAWRVGGWRVVGLAGVRLLGCYGCYGATARDRAEAAQPTHTAACARAAAACLEAVGAVRGAGSGQGLLEDGLGGLGRGRRPRGGVGRRQRSESEARMLMHTVRSRGWCSLLVLKELASCRCCSVGADRRRRRPCGPAVAVGHHLRVVRRHHLGGDGQRLLQLRRTGRGARCARTSGTCVCEKSRNVFLLPLALHTGVITGSCCVLKTGRLLHGRSHISGMPKAAAIPRPRPRA